MKIAIITPYYQESLEVLWQCHLSVINQKVNIPFTHFLIADGFAKHEINTWNAKHITLPNSHDDNGNTPRGLGSLLAKSEGYDFIAYLDADNWYHENHLQSMLDNWKENQTPVISCYRTFHHEDGEQLLFQEPIETSLDHIDTSCFFLHKTCYDVLDIWLKMPKILSPICDPVFYSAIKNKNYKISSTRNRTVGFRSKYLSHYLYSQKKLPKDLKTEEVFASALEFLSSNEGISECVKTIGFWPLSYIKSFHILFCSTINSDLSTLAKILASHLSNRKIIGYAMSDQPHDSNNPQILKLANEIQYKDIKLKKIQFNELDLARTLKMDFIINIIGNESSEYFPLQNPVEKIINWKINNLPSSNKIATEKEFSQILMEMKLKIERLISIPSQAITFDAIEAALNS